MKKTIRIFLSGVLALSMFASQGAFAGYVPSNQALITQKTEETRANVISMMEREDVRQLLEEQGVSAEEVQARLAMLSPAQIDELQTQIDTIPAGEGALGAIIGAALVIFLVLLFTDVVGATNVYGFTN